MEQTNESSEQVEEGSGNSKVNPLSSIKYLKIFGKVGSEPVMFLFMIGFRLVFVIEEAFYLFKACRANLGYSEEVCRHISEPQYNNYSAKAQIIVSSFIQYNNAAYLGIPAVISLYIGAWSDRVGRKIPMLLGICGYMVHTLMMAIISINENWKLESVLFAATIPGALTGRDWTVYMACYSYMSDTTTQQERTLRSNLLGVAFLLPVPIGVFLGSYLFNGLYKGSFLWMFITSALTLLLAIVYTIIFISKKSCKQSEGKTRACPLSRVTETITTLVKPRTVGRRLLLILSLTVVALSVIMRDETKIIQLFAFWKFNWNVKTYSLFKTFESSTYVIGLLIVGPILQKVLNQEDAYILMVGSVSYVASRMIYIFTDSTLWLYIGAGVGGVGPIIGTVGRSIISKTVDSSERGKIFSLVGIAELAFRLLFSFGYSQIYIHTFKTSFPEAFFVLSVGSEAVVFFIALYIHFSILRHKNVLVIN